MFVIYFKSCGLFIIYIYSLCRRSPSPSGERSRSVSLSPVRKSSVVEKDSTLDVTIPDTTKTTDELEEESKHLHLEKERETAEQEVLRREVAKLESTIDNDVMTKVRQRRSSGAESSATDASDNEIDVDMQEILKEVDPGDVVELTVGSGFSPVSSAGPSSPDPGKTVDQKSEKEELKREIMERLLQKQKGRTDQ